jgi:hypothetical protein
MKSINNGEVMRIVAKRAIEEELSPKKEDGWLHVAASAEHLSAMHFIRPLRIDTVCYKDDFLSCLLCLSV